MKPKTTIVTTTIHVPTFLNDYEQNALHFGHEVDFVVVGDVKTPALETVGLCSSIPNCVYLDIPTQKQFMARFPALWEHLPFNSVERRNIGLLWAYEKDADVIITLDDDNFATSQDAVGHHQIVGNYPLLSTFGSSSGWFNVCAGLKEQNDVEFYHRGFPAAQRWKEGFITDQGPRNHVRRVAVNAGLWLDNPDVDAITRLERELVVTQYKPNWPSTFALASGTWSPFNCQNTALARNVIPAYFMSPAAGRHADILASFVVNRLAEHFNEAITFGSPLAIHKRTPHDLWKDLDGEREGLRMADSFCDKLRKIELNALSYHQGFGQIIEGLMGFNTSTVEQNMLVGMALWHQAFHTLFKEKS